jgi:hypothetical protein
MKNVTKVQSRTEPGLNPSLPVSCPYCGAVTMINRLMTEPKCRHFEDFTLFKNEGNAFCEVEDPGDKVVMSEATFRLTGSRHHSIEKELSGDLIEDGEGMKLRVKGKFDSFLSQDDFEDMFFDDEDSDTVRGE